MQQDDDGANSDDSLNVLQYPIYDAPPNDGPFIADVLCTIFLFVADKSTLLAVSSVNRMWRFYANYLPQWTILRAREELFSSEILLLLDSDLECRLPQSAATRDTHFEITRSVIEEVKAREKRERAQRRKELLEFALAMMLQQSMILGMLVTHWVVSWALGYHPGIERSIIIATTTVFCNVPIFVVTLLLQYLSTKVSRHCEDSLRPFAVTVLLVGICCIPVALLGARLRSAELVVEGRSASLAEIAGVPESWASGSPNSAEPTSSAPPSYVTLPAAVADGWELLWRDAPIDSASVADVCCMPRTGNLCFVLLRLTSLSPAAVALADSQSCAATAAAAVANGTVARGSLLAAVVGGSRGVPHVHQAARATALSYRSLRRTPFFNADRPWGVAGEYYSETNVLWRDARVPLVDVGWREGIAEGRERVQSLETSRDALAIALALLSVSLLVLLPFMVGRDAAFRLIVRLILIFANPLMFLLFGFLCIGIHDSSPQKDGRWLMCDDEVGGTLVSVGGIYLLLFFGVCVRKHGFS